MLANETVFLNNVAILNDFFRIVNLFLSIVLYTKPIFFSFFMEIWYTEIRKITRIFLF